MMWSKSLLVIIALFYSIQVTAQMLPQDQVPEPLLPWVDWVLFDQKDLTCPFTYNNYRQKQCTWPTRLDLELNDQEGRFSMQWKIYEQQWVTLPGDNKFWPQKVTVNKKPAAVLQKHGRPAVQLSTGNYHIEGRFKWDYLPKYISVPNNSALIELQINGKSVDFPYLKQDRLWLKQTDHNNQNINKKQDTLDIQVFRKIIDDVPLKILTRIEMDVSGRQRELRLAKPMLTGFIAMNLQSPIPARLEKDGSLLIQAKPGRWVVEILSRSSTPITQLPFTKQNPDWPNTEIWVFEARPYLRIVEIEKLNAIDPQQSNLPARWRQFPAYQISSGESMVFNVIRQGDPQPEPNKLSLQRKLWLDFDGKGYTVNDQISGQMSRGWRLDVMPDMQLGRVSLDGRSQLITQLAQTDQQGIEVRQGHLDVSADSRITGSIGNISATGWQQNFNQVNAVLNLPPGWRLFAAGGVDNMPQSWISRWTLLDLFLVLIVSLAIGRMWTWQWGLMALFSLTLIWHEPGAPRFIWLNLVAVFALLKVLPAGRFFDFIKLYRNVCFVALVLICIPFMIAQVRIGLYPQLQKPGQPITVTSYNSTPPPQRASVPLSMMESVALDASMSPKARNMSVQLARKTGASERELAVNFNRIDPHAIIQTGPGLPQWQWQSIQLSWNGPVDAQQNISFWLIPPTLSMLLNFMRVILVVVMALFMFGLINERFRFEAPDVKLLSLVLILPLLLAIPDTSVASYPDEQLLKQLRNRLIQPPDCLPGCAEVERMQININQENLHLTQVIHVNAAVAVPLPANIQQWYPMQVLINNNTAKGLYRDPSGILIVNLKPGQHVLELIGKIPPIPSFSIPLPLKIHQVNIVENQGWDVDGLHEQGQVDQQLQFTRQAVETTDTLQQSALQPGLLPAFMQLQRTLQLGLDWRVENRLVRQTAADRPVLLEIPLLAGESVISANVRVRDGKVLVNMAAGQNVLIWNSILDKSKKIHLLAPETQQWVEIWQADISPIWHLTVTGIAVVHHQDKQGRWLPEWRPWPGQSVDLSITRPAPVAGQNLTIDKSELLFKPGQRNRDVTLSLQIRSSQGLQHTLTLPEQAILQSVKINSKTQPIRQKLNQVTIPIKPGYQDVVLNWLDSSEMSSLLTTPKVDLGVTSINSHIKMVLGADRWVLLTFGPRMGPAVLFWGMLMVLTVIAIGLGRIPLTPLKHWQWLLLLIGLSQVEIAAALVVVAWLVLLGWRAKKIIAHTGYFNATQIGLGLLTLVSILILFVAVQQGLLGSPQMQISGNQSSAYHLNWYQDHSPQQFPTASIVSVPLKVYRLLMLAWSLWLAVSLLDWLKWGWNCFSKQTLWKQRTTDRSNPLQMPNQDNKKSE